MNAGAFNLGAGLSFALPHAVKAAVLPSDPTSPADHTAGVIGGVVILVAAIATPFVIPKPVRAEPRGWSGPFGTAATRRRPGPAA